MILFCSYRGTNLFFWNPSVPYLFLERQGRGHPLDCSRGSSELSLSSNSVPVIASGVGREWDVSNVNATEMTWIQKWWKTYPGSPMFSTRLQWLIKFFTMPLICLSYSQKEGVKRSSLLFTPKYVANTVSTEQKCTVVNKSIKLLFFF